MEERLVKTHLIVTDVTNEYHIDWCGKILDTKPEFHNGKPIFIIVGGNGRTEINTTDMARIEKCAKLMSKPKGRTAISTDVSKIYIKEVDGKETLLGTLTHNRVKHFSPMYDRIGYR